MSGTHKVQSIEDINSSLIETYSYDLNGNIVNRSDTDSNSKDYYWDESNRLRVVDDQTAMQHYIYDAGGQRVLKASSQVESVYENGTLSSTSVTFDAYTTYPSAFIVVAPDGNYSKHYYSGSQRIVSRIGEETAEIFEGQSSVQRTAPPQKGDEKPLDEVALRNLQLNDLTLLLAKKSKAVPTFNAYQKDSGEELEGDSVAIKAMEVATTNIEIPDQAPYRDIYFYHPDHLGSSTYLTDANGMPYQFFLNLPFGETMAEQHSLTEDYATPYKFNGKELDRETGLYYYGARYYDPKTSIWLSVDPMADKYPSINPYVYCNQNPVTLSDPTGMYPLFPYPDLPSFKSMKEHFPQLSRSSTIYVLQEIPFRVKSGKGTAIKGVPDDEKKRFRMVLINEGDDPDAPIITIKETISGVNSLDNKPRFTREMRAGTTESIEIKFPTNTNEISNKEVFNEMQLQLSAYDRVEIAGNTTLARNEIAVGTINGVQRDVTANQLAD